MLVGERASATRAWGLKWWASQFLSQGLFSFGGSHLRREARVTQEELAGYTVLAGYGVMLLGAIKVFGLRRVVIVLFGIVFFAVAIAFKSLGTVSGRRY